MRRTSTPPAEISRDERVRDRDPPGQGHGPGARRLPQLSPREPAQLQDLLAVRDGRAGAHHGAAAEHQGARERPGLGAQVLHVPHGQARFLGDLADHGLLQGLPRLHEPGHAAVHRNREGAAPREQGLTAVSFDQGDDGGGQARDGQQAAEGREEPQLVLDVVVLVAADEDEGGP